MQPFQLRALRLSQEIDRYLLGTTEHLQDLPAQDKPELSISVQLLRADFSHQSRIRAHLRQSLETELGTRSSDPANRLILYASSRRRAGLIKNFWPALFVLVIILAVWSLKSTASTATATKSSPLQPTPEMIVATLLATNQQAEEFNPRPIPTPLSPDMVSAYLSASTVPALQQTPFGLSYPIPDTARP